MITPSWPDALSQSFQGLWVAVANFVPNLLGALFIFIAGWLIGALLGRVVAQVIRALHVDDALRNIGLDEVLNRAGFELDSGMFLGGLVELFVVVVFLIATLSALHLDQVNVFLTNVVATYLPQVIIATLIILITAVIAEMLQRIVMGATMAANLTNAPLLGAIAKWAVWIFGIMVALNQLSIGQFFAQELFRDFALMLTLAFGLAFGLGGRDHASKFLDTIEHEVTHHKK